MTNSEPESRRRELDSLITRRNGLVAELDNANLDGKLTLGSQIAKLNAEIEERILDSMDRGIKELGSQVRSLNDATTTLNKTVEKLESSSGRLNTITEALLVLTGVLAVVGAGSYTLQAFNQVGFTGQTAVNWATFTDIIIVIFILIAFTTIVRKASAERRAGK